MIHLLLFGLVCAAVTAAIVSRRGRGQHSGGKDRGHPVLRWLAGHTHRTNATFTRRSTKDKTDNARRWDRHPGAVRAGARSGTVTASVVLVYGLVTAPAVTVIAIAAAFACPAAAGGWWLYRKARRWWPAKSG